MGYPASCPPSYIEIPLHEDDSTVEAKVDHHLLYLGLEVRVELTLEDGQHHWAQLTREHAWRRGLDRGKQVHVRISHSKSFVNAAEGSLQKS